MQISKHCNQSFKNNSFLALANGMCPVKGSKRQHLICPRGPGSFCRAHIPHMWSYKLGLCLSKHYFFPALCYCCFGLWVPTSHVFHEVPLKEGVYGWDEERKKASHLPAWWWTICFRHSLFLPRSSSQGGRLWLRWRKEENLPFPSLKVNYLFSLFLSSSTLIYFLELWQCQRKYWLVNPE